MALAAGTAFSLILRGAAAFLLLLTGVFTVLDGDWLAGALALCLCALTVYFAWRRLQRAPAAAGAESTARRPASLWTPIVLASILLMFDGVMLGGTPMLSVFFLLGTIFGGIPWALAALRERRILVTRLRSVAVLLATIAAIIGYSAYDSDLADQRMLAAARALNSYKAKSGRYPQQLEALVPEFLPAAPKARSFGMGSRVYYLLGQDGRAQLMYVALPPFGRRVLAVDSGEWSMLD